MKKEEEKNPSTPLFLLLISVRRLRLGEACGRDDVCADANANCRPGFCTCNAGFSQYQDICGGPGSVGTPCSSGCNDPLSTCQAGQCVCKIEYWQLQGVCHEKVPLGEMCSDEDVCQDDDALCLDGFCVCDVMHYNQGNQCGEYYLRACGKLSSVME